MNGALVEAAILSYVSKLGRGEVNIPTPIMETMMKEISDTLIHKDRDDAFRIRLSSVGKPLCQLILEKQGQEKIKAEPMRNPMRLMVGDMLEAYIVALIRASELPVVDVQIPVKLSLAGQDISGTADIIIGDTVYDIKTASDFSFSKFKSGFHSIVDNDPFGYVAQGYCYAAALNLKFGGWIVLNKNSGDICVCATPDNDEAYKKAALETAEASVLALINNEEFKRCFTDEEETFSKKSTGNRKLNVTCSYCDFRFSCWNNLQLKPSAFSTAMSPPLVHYTEYNYAKKRDDEGNWNIEKVES